MLCLPQQLLHLFQLHQNFNSTRADPMTDWRALYEWREEEYEAKLKASGERLKQMTHAVSSARDVKSIQVSAMLSA